MAPQKVHILELPYEHSAEELYALLAPEIHLTVGPEVAPDCEIVVGGYLTREQLLASSSLRALIIPWAGMPQPTRTLLLDFPQIAVHNLHHNALPVAEMAITLLLTAAKSIIPSDQALRVGDWSPRFRQPDPAVLIHGKTAVILGYGAIGRRVASMCHGLGMRVLAVRRTPPASNATQEQAEDIQCYPSDALDRLLPQADALLICLPHTPETHRLIGAEQLRLLPPRAILVNVSRAEIVDEAALYHALHDGTLYAAGLDVWYAYPDSEDEPIGTAPSAYPFHELQNVVMSPHRAGHAHETERLRVTALAELLNTAARGEPMPNRVDLASGY